MFMEKNTGVAPRKGTAKQMNKTSFFGICLKKRMLVLLISRNLFRIRRMSEIIEENENMRRPAPFMKNCNYENKN